MIRYWPNKQSIKLNHAVVDLFLDTENKLIYNLSNKTNYYLYIDILNNLNKTQLFYIILKEFKKLILDIVELNLNKENLQNLNKQILYVFIEAIYVSFSYNIKTKYYYTSTIIAREDDTLINNLLIYLIFGSSQIDNNLFLFDQMYTPYKHVQILFENFVIQMSNITIYNLINNLSNSSSSTINNLLKTNKICHKLYTSNRSVVFFLNNLRWQNLLSSYIFQPKCIYNERYQVWLISSRGIITKYIYATRMQEIKKLTKPKIFFLLWLEIKDIITPKIEKLLIQIGQYLVYFSINLLSNTIILIMRVIIFYLG